MHLVGSSPTNSSSVVWLTNRSISSTLHLDDLASLNLGTAAEPRVFGEKNARKLLEAIERARHLPLARWLHALAIPEVGEETAHDLAKFHQSMEDVADSQLLRDVIALDRLRKEMASANPRAKSNRSKSQREREDLVQGYQHLVQEADQIGRRLIEAGFAERAKRKDARDSDAVTKIGPVVARAALEWFSSERGRKVLERLRALGIQPRGATSTTVQNAFAGKTFVLTGSLERMPRSASAGNNPVSRRQCQRKRQSQNGFRYRGTRRRLETDRGNCAWD